MLVCCTIFTLHLRDRDAEHPRSTRPQRIGRFQATEDRMECSILASRVDKAPGLEIVGRRAASKRDIRSSGLRHRARSNERGLHRSAMIVCTR